MFWMNTDFPMANELPHASLHIWCMVLVRCLPFVALLFFATHFTFNEQSVSTVVYR